MCGIVGMLGTPDREVLARMLAAITHRGPDDEGTHFSPPVALGSRRLSIIDLAGGHQPMTNEDGSLWVSFNGEIYNHAEVREELLSRGHTFRTHCDTEVLLHAYEEDGDDFVHRLLGIFAFALWDGPRRRLLLARDRLGKKPLYYASLAGGGLAFGSELRSLLQHPGVRRGLNLRSLVRFLTFGYVPPPDTIHEGIQALLPGHCLIVEPGAVPKLERYWHLSLSPGQDRGEDAFAEEFRDLFQDSVRRRLVADVPVGAFLSGGLDSSSVVAAMRSLSSGPVRTFTIGFANSAFRFDETADAREVARAYGTEHEEWILTEAEVLGSLDRIIDHMEQPCATGLPTYFASELARRSVTVVLGGVGGDELFAGYPRHLGMRLLPLYRRLSPGLRNAILGPVVEALPGSIGGVNWVRRAQLLVRSAPRDEIGQYLAWSSVFLEEEVATLLRPELREAGGEARSLFDGYLAEADGWPFSNKVLFLDVKTYLPFDLLDLTDRLSMAHSLEVRMPYCDHRMVEFAARLPYRYKLRGLTGKYLVRRALAGRLPARVFRKGKQGFSVPMGLWLKGGLRPLVEDCLSPASLERRGFFHPAPVARMLSEQFAGTHDWTYRIWALAALEMWMRRSESGAAAEVRS